MTRFKYILAETANGVRTLTLNRPEKRNALSPEVIEELTGALQDAAECSCGVVILTGAGPAFCSGLDLDHLATISARTPEENRRDSENVARVLARSLRLSQAGHRRGERAGDRRRHGPRHHSRFHPGGARSQVRLHRSPHRLCAGDCGVVSAPPNGRKAYPRPAPDRPPDQGAGGAAAGAGDADCHRRTSSCAPRAPWPSRCCRTVPRPCRA